MSVEILVGDALDVVAALPANSIQCVVTSPPFFGLRDYGHERQVGGEPTVDEYARRLVAILRECRRALRKDGTLWLELGDRHVPARPARRGDGLKPKDLFGAPWTVALALRSDGWFLREECIWHKPDATPEPITDRPTRDHSTVFLLAKSARYFYDTVAMRVPAASSANRTKTRRRAGHSIGGKTATDFPWRSADGLRKLRTVWTLPKGKSVDPVAAAFPTALAERCIRASSSEGDVVLDPFAGTGTVGLVANRIGRSAVLVEINEDRARIAMERIREDVRQ